MPDTKVLLQNSETGDLEPIALGDVHSALASGKYRETKSSQVDVGVAGSAVGTSAGEAATVAELGADVSEGAARTSAAEHAKDVAASASAYDRATVFIEGLADMASMGLIRERGTEADLRREANPGTEFAGQLAGAFLPLPGAVMSAGRGAGRVAAKAVLGEIKAGTRAAVAAKVLESTVEGAALMGAQSLGTQISDAVLDDKPFVGEAVLHDLKMGAAFGLGFGAVGAGAERALSRATRAEAAAGGGLADPASAVSQRVNRGVREGVDSMHAMLDSHEARLGIAEVLGKEGGVPARLVKDHRELVGSARRARAKLESLDADVALSGSDPKAYARWRDAMEDYQEKLVAVDERLAPHLRDAAGMQAFQDLPRVELGAPRERLGIERPIDDMEAVRAGHVDRDAFALDAQMTPERLADYERIYGRPFQSMDEALVELEPHRIGPADELPGGKVSGTSENKTNPGRRAKGEPVAEVAENVVQVELAPEREALRGPGPATAPGRVLRPRAEPGNRLNEAYSDEELVLRPDGWFQVPPVNTEENARLFARFQDKMAVDTRAARAHKAESVEKFRLGQAEPKTRPLARENWTPEEREFMEIGKRRNGTPPGPPGAGPPIAQPIAPPVVEPGTRAGRRAEPRPTPPETPAARRPGGKRAVREYVDRWYAEARERAVASPADRSAGALRDVVDRIRSETGGALDAAGTVDLLGAQRIAPARSSFGGTLDQIHSARQLARAVADVSRGRGLGGSNPASKAGRHWMLKWMGERVGGRIGSNVGRKVLGSALGGAVGGPAGYVLGAVFADRVMGFAGRAAGAAGRVQTKILSAAAGLVSSKLPIRVAAAASARPSPSYLPGEDPIADPVERSMHVRELASNPDAYRAKLRAALGDLPALHPDVMEPAIDNQVRNVVQLSLRAPMIFWDSLGRPSASGSQDVRRWIDLEAAAHDVMSTLDAVGSGTATDSQIEGLRAFHPRAYSRLVAAIVADPDKFLGRTREQLKLISRIAGVPLTPGADPAFVARQQQAWQVHSTPPPNGLTAPPPTPSQAGSRQPGNPGVSPSPR